MCTFVTAVLPQGADIVRIRAVLGPSSQALRPLVNRSVQRCFGAEACYYRAYESSCDCGVALGGAAYDAGSSRPPEEQVPALRKKGWREAKIRRWLVEKREATARKLAERESKAKSDLQRWRRLLDATVGSGASPWAALLIHEYSGGLETEAISLVGREEISMSRASDELLRNLHRDVLYVFRP